MILRSYKIFFYSFMDPIVEESAKRILKGFLKKLY